jgi:hypothetical protein
VRRNFCKPGVGVMTGGALSEPEHIAGQASPGD